MASKSTAASALLSSAKKEGVLSAQSFQALNVADIGAQIQAGIGISVDDVQASDVVLVTIMPDDSGSIAAAGNTDIVCDGHNLVIDSLITSKQKEGILLHTRYLNGQVLNPYTLLDQALRMDRGNFDPCYGTPLFDQSVILLGTVMAKAQEFSDNGVPVRTVTLIISDGEELHSRRQTAASVSSIVKDLLATETNIVAAMGIDDGGCTDFQRVFTDMGIRPEWILTPKNSQSEIRKAFQVFSQSAVRASQSAANFSKTAAGGFGTP